MKTWRAAAIGLVVLGASFLAAWFLRSSTDHASSIVETAPSATNLAATAPAPANQPRASTNANALPPSMPRPVSTAEQEALHDKILAKELESLLERARREPNFAYELAHALYECSHADEELAKVSRLAAVLKTSPEARLAVLEEKFAMCKGLRTQDMDLQYELMTAAARAGDFDAQLNYVDLVKEALRTGYAMRKPNAMDELRANYEQFTLAAARTGNSEALYRAFSMYDNGLVIARDPVQAYHYLEMYSRTLSAAQAAMVRARLESLNSQMSAEQRARARSG